MTAFLIFRLPLGSAKVSGCFWAVGVRWNGCDWVECGNAGWQRATAAPWFARLFQAADIAGSFFRVRLRDSLC